MRFVKLEGREMSRYYIEPKFRVFSANFGIFLASIGSLGMLYAFFEDEIFGQKPNIWPLYAFIVYFAIPWIVVGLTGRKTPRGPYLHQRISHAIGTGLVTIGFAGFLLIIMMSLNELQRGSSSHTWAFATSVVAIIIGAGLMSLIFYWQNQYQAEGQHRFPPNVRFTVGSVIRWLAFCFFWITAGMMLLAVIDSYLWETYPYGLVLPPAIIMVVLMVVGFLLQMSHKGNPKLESR
jgi:hypothetical protein